MNGHMPFGRVVVALQAGDDMVTDGCLRRMPDDELAAAAAYATGRDAVVLGAVEREQTQRAGAVA